jgi:hypothetical protein
MRVIFSIWTYEQHGRPMPGREGGHPLSSVIPDKTIAEGYPIAYDEWTQAHLDIDEAVNADLCADLMRRAGAYWVDAAGELNVDVDWSEDI